MVPPLHRSNLVKKFLETTIPKRFIKEEEWPPNSSDSKPFEYYFRDKVRTKVYDGRLNKPFKDENEMIRGNKLV